MWSVPNRTARLCLVLAVSLLCLLCINIGSVEPGSGISGDTGASVEQQSGNISFPLEHCGCVRTLARPSPAGQGAEYSATTCGRDAYTRQTCRRCLTMLGMKSTLNKLSPPEIGTFAHGIMGGRFPDGRLLRYRK